MFQGKPIATILFKILSTDVVGQGLYFAQDSKFAPSCRGGLRSRPGQPSAASVRPSQAWRRRPANSDAVKLAHYLKIPSRTLFFAQGLGTILGALTQVGVTLWMLGNVDGICDDDQPNGFTCPNGLTVYSSSIIWGLIGPARLYSAGKIYSGLVRPFFLHLDLHDRAHAAHTKSTVPY